MKSLRNYLADNVGWLIIVAEDEGDENNEADVEGEGVIIFVLNELF